MTTCTADTAVERKTVWKSELMLRYAVALVDRAVEIRLAYGVTYFNSDDCPDWGLPGDKTTIGAATRLLLNAGVIAPFRETLAELDIFGGIRKSSRPCCNGHRNQLYTLVSIPVAQAFLARNGLPAMKEQMEFKLS